MYQAKVLSTLIDILPVMLEDEMMAGKVLRLIVILGRHNISINELKKIFGVIKKAVEEKDIRRISKLLSQIQEMTLREGPSASFDFDGTTHCGIQLPSFKLTGSGYTFCAWIRLEEEEFLVQRSQNQPPKIVSLLNKDGDGIVISISPSVVFTSLHSGNSVYEQPFKFQF